MRVMITGSNGFIGSHLIEYLSTKHIIIEFTRSKGHDITNETQIKEFIQYHPPHAIIHLAGNPNTKINEADPCEHLKINVLPTTYILQYIRPNTRFIYLSSGSIYGNGSLNYPNVEKDDLKPTSLYALSKKISEQYIKFYTKQKSLLTTILRPAANVGKNNTHGVISDLARKIINSSGHIDVLGDCPGSCKPYIHVSDTVRCIDYVINHNVIGTYNLSTPNSITIEQILQIAFVHLPRKDINWLGQQANWPGDNRIVALNNKKLLSTGFRLNYPTSESAVDQAFKELT